MMNAAKIPDHVFKEKIERCDLKTQHNKTRVLPFTGMGTGKEKKTT